MRSTTPFSTVTRLSDLARREPVDFSTHVALTRRARLPGRGGCAILSDMTEPKDIAARAVTKFHEAIFRASKGRIAGKLFGMPVLILTTTGRKSGERRSTMLTSPVVDGDTIVIVASYGGDDRNPTWYLNLRADPNVEVMMRGKETAMRARVASEDEKAELWPRVVKSYKGYAAYQTRTDRDIPLVILEPAND